jgi:hypothetical protein
MKLGIRIPRIRLLLKVLTILRGRLFFCSHTKDRKEANDQSQEDLHLDQTDEETNRSKPVP